MVSKTWNAMLVAAIASIMTTAAMTQELPASAPAGISANSYRMVAISKYGLDNPALRLSPEQRAEIDKILDAHVARQIAVNKQYPLPKNGARPSPAEIQARQAVTSNVTAALSQVMNSEQRKMWEAEQAARRSLAEGKAPSSVAPKR